MMYTVRTVALLHPLTPSISDYLYLICIIDVYVDAKVELCAPF